MKLEFKILENHAVVFEGAVDTPLELGRQQAHEAAPYALARTDDGARLIVASLKENTVARRQLKIDGQTPGNVELTNLSKTAAVSLLAGEVLAPGQSIVVKLPTSIFLEGKRQIDVDVRRMSVTMGCLDSSPLAPGGSHGDFKSLVDYRGSWESQQRIDQLIRALQVTMDVFQSAASDEELYDRAIAGAMELVGFETAHVLLYEAGEWLEARSSRAPRRSAAGASQHVLASVLRDKRTYWETGLGKSSITESLRGVHAVVAAPFLDSRGELLGVLYGEGRDAFSDSGAEVTNLDASLMELLACGVASGLARLQQQQVAQKMRLQFEQFFTPDLARQLESNPNLLEGRDAQVTILFCDIRGFSRICEKIGAAGTFKWINDVLGVLSDCVIRRQGVLVDYVGDELMAMWGAPDDQPDHAERACRAAIEMLDSLAELNDRWQTILGEPIDVGVGINSGTVRAGNSGSARKFKYGPVGNPVNLASRVKGATKYLKTRLLLTGETADQLGDNFPRRRLCDVRVVNIQEPVRLYELVTCDEPLRSTLCDSYETALTAFDWGEFRQAAKVLAEMLNTCPDDGPSLVLMSRAVRALIEGEDPQHPVWELPGK